MSDKMQIASPGSTLCIELGETWQCSCGEQHTAGGAWLAAHWHYFELEHKCDKCGAVRALRNGILMTPAETVTKPPAVGGTTRRARRVTPDG